MRVSLLGLGHMGVPIARRLLAAGHELAVWNRTAAAAEPLAPEGASVLDTPRAAWSQGDVALLTLADDRAVRAVLEGAQGLLVPGPAGRTVVDMSTISVAASAELAARADAVGVTFLRSPVTGNPSVVEAGRLGIIVSGPREAFDRLRPLLGDVGPTHFYVGDGEQARVVKLALNLMLHGTAQLLAEALVMTERHGIERAAMLEVAGGSAIGSPFVKYKTEALIADDYSSTFTTRTLYKDVSLMLECAEDVQVPLPFMGILQQLAQGCVAQGMGELDMMALLPRLRREAGLDP